MRRYWPHQIGGYPTGQLLKRLLVVLAIVAVVTVVLKTGLVHLDSAHSADYNQGYDCGQTMAAEPQATDMTPEEQMSTMERACDHVARTLGVTSMQEFHKGFVDGLFAGPDNPPADFGD